MTTESMIAAGQQAFERQAWRDAYEALSAACAEAPLDLNDLERLATAAYMVGEHTDCARMWTQAHHASIDQKDLRRAARCAFQQACGLLFRNELAPAMGWVARGKRVLEDIPGECSEQAWLISLNAFPLMVEGDLEGAAELLEEAFGIAERAGDPEIRAYVRLEYGPTLVMQGRTAEGLAMLDEMMVAVTAGEVSPIISGIAYCQMIGTCKNIFDWRRAREWTEAFSRWCDSQSGIAMYYGNCLLDRCQLLQLQGAWPEAMDVAERACEVLADHHPETAGSARYQMAEIQRLRGNLAEAEESYRRASQAGRDPEPGMSLLRLAQGRPDSAAGAIKRALDEAEGPMDRCRVLPSFVEIMLATGDLESARAGADELAAIAAEQQAPFFWALAAHRCGAVMLAQEDYRGALNQLRDASKRWQEIGAPYEAACVRILIAQAMQALGDDEGAALELDGARWALRQLGAERDVPGLRDASEISAVAGLTARECEVLALLAAGKTNKQISSDLTISEHTVARHLQNIFAKLGVSSRTGAIAFAFENNLVSRPDS